MGRPKKVVEQPESLGTEVEQPPVKAEAVEVVSKPQLVANALDAKKKALAKEEADLADKLKEVSAEFMAGTKAPLFVPYKDRDGKIVPALVLGLFQTEKRDPHTNELILSKDREVQREFRASVWVFSNMSEPHRAVYSIPSED